MIVTILAFLGLMFGSFVNALVWRLHEQLSSKKKSQDKKLSISHGRSMCPRCKHELVAKDLVPVFSWLSLRGKCRYCHKPIAWQYPLVELLTAALFVVSYLCWPLDWNALGIVQFVVWLGMLTGLMALLIYDIRWMLLPNRIIYPLLVAALALVAYVAITTTDMSYLIDAGTAVLIGGGIFFLLFQVSGGRWIGGGDVKLGTLAGLLLADPFLAFLMLFVASLGGTLLVLPGLLLGKVKTTSRIPFGPFLIVATILVKLFGVSVIEWYKRSLGLF